MIRIQHKEHGWHNILPAELEAHLKNGWEVVPDESEKEPPQPIPIRQRLTLPKKA